MSDTGHSVRATRALRRLGEDDPAFAALALWCAHRDATEAAAPAWTDGATIWYGPRFEALPPHEQVGVAAHQILHVAFRHAPRSTAMWRRFGAAFDAELFNLAADALVNETLQLAGYALPRPCVTVCELVRATFGETLAPEEAVGRYDAEALCLRLAARPAQGAGRRAAAGDGAGDGGAAERARAYAASRKFAEDVVRGRADPAAARREAAEEAEWRQRVARALEAGRRAGAGLGAVGWRLADLPRTRTPWETVLRGLVTRAVTRAPRIAYARPSRRWIARDDAARRDGQAAPAFEPAALPWRAAPRIAVGIDASASVDGDLLALFAAQVAGIGRRTGAEVHVLVFDETVRSQARMHGVAWEREIVDVAFARGGGTSFVDVVAAAARLEPAAIVILTDLDGPFGPAPRGIPVIWAAPQDQPVAAAPPFGRVISLAR